MNSDSLGHNPVQVCMALWKDYAHANDVYTCRCVNESSPLLTSNAPLILDLSLHLLHDISSRLMHCVFTYTSRTCEALARPRLQRSGGLPGTAESHAHRSGMMSARPRAIMHARSKRSSTHWPIAFPMIFLSCEGTRGPAIQQNL